MKAELPEKVPLEEQILGWHTVGTKIGRFELAINALIDYCAELGRTKACLDDLQLQEKGCETCGNNKPSEGMSTYCSVNDGIWCCRYSTWRSWIPKKAEVLQPAEDGPVAALKELFDKCEPHSYKGTQMAVVQCAKCKRTKLYSWKSDEDLCCQFCGALLSPKQEQEKKDCESCSIDPPCDDNEGPCGAWQPKKSEGKKASYGIYVYCCRPLKNSICQLQAIGDISYCPFCGAKL